MRICFLPQDEDPHRGDRSIRLEEDHSTIIVHGRIPQTNTVNIRIGWREGFTLLEGIEKQEAIDPYFDPDGQLVVSGYRLLDAGVIDDRVQVQDIVAISEGGARMCFMMRYEEDLAKIIMLNEPNCLADPVLERWAALARHNLSDARNWLAGFGLFPVRLPRSTKN
jgi:hypothetical protein